MPPAVREGISFAPGAARVGSKAVGAGGSVFPSPCSAEAGLGFSKSEAGCARSAVGNLEGFWERRLGRWLPWMGDG